MNQLPQTLQGQVLALDWDDDALSRRQGIDGQDAQLLRANLAFRAVRLPAGEHVVEFTYMPGPFQVGLWISAASFLLLIGLWVLGRVTPVRKPYLASM